MWCWSIFRTWEVQETSVQKTTSQPKQSAAFGGRLLRLFWGLKRRCSLDLQNKKYPPAPACQGPPGCEARDFNHLTFNSFQYSISKWGICYLMSCRSAIWWLLMVYCTPESTIYLRLSVLSQPGVALKINEISMHIQYTNISWKLSLKLSKKCPKRDPKRCLTSSK